MTANDAMIEIGIANAAMMVDLKFQRKKKTTTAANRPPRIRCSSIAVKLF